MKNKTLQQYLAQFDDDAEVSVGNHDIHYVGIEEAYYDGKQEVLIRDENKQCYNIIGAKYRCKNYKVVIHPLSIKDAIENDPDMPVDFSEIEEYMPSSLQYYQDLVQKWRETIIKIYHDLDESHFIKYLNNRLNADVSEDAKLFYNQNFSWRDKIPTSIKTDYEKQNKGTIDSWHNRLEALWYAQVKVYHDNEKLILEKVEIQ